MNSISEIIAKKDLKMYNGFEGHSYPAMPERPESWFNPDEPECDESYDDSDRLYDEMRDNELLEQYEKQKDAFDEELEELEVISDDELDEQDQRAWDEFQNDFFNYQRERGKSNV